MQGTWVRWVFPTVFLSFLLAGEDVFVGECTQVPDAILPDDPSKQSDDDYTTADVEEITKTVKFEPSADQNTPGTTNDCKLTSNFRTSEDPNDVSGPGCPNGTANAKEGTVMDGNAAADRKQEEDSTEEEDANKEKLLQDIIEANELDEEEQLRLFGDKSPAPDSSNDAFHYPSPAPEKMEYNIINRSKYNSCKPTIGSFGILEEKVCNFKPPYINWVPKSEDTAREDICYAVILAGGGNLGSYQAGAVLGLAEAYVKLQKKLRWDVVAGVSVGAFNAFASRYSSPGDEVSWGNLLKDLWLNQVKQKNLSDCKLPLGSNLFKWAKLVITSKLSKTNKPMSLCSNLPLQQFIEDRLHGLHVKPDRHIALSASRINDGHFVTFTEKCSEKDLMRAVMASSALPVIFPPIELPEGSKKYYFDGALIDNGNISAAVQHCMNVKNVPAEKVVVDIIDCVPKRMRYFSVRPGLHSLVDLFLRAAKIMQSQTTGDTCISKAYAQFPGFRLRHYVRPRPLIFNVVHSGLSLFDLSPRHIKKLVELGELEGRNQIAVEVAV